MSKKIILLVCFFLFFFVPFHADAASLTITSDQTSIISDNEYATQVNLTINTADGTQYYLRAVFAKEGSSNYCGFTWNGNDWFNGPYSSNDGWKNFLPITIMNNTWSGEVKAKIDSNDSGCSSSGTYTFKIERFTSSGSGSFDSQNDQEVAITVPSPTNTPTPIPTNTPTSKPTHTSTPSPTIKVVSVTVASNPTILKATNTITLNPSTSQPLYEGDEQMTASRNAVLGSSISASPTFSPTRNMKKKKTQMAGIQAKNIIPQLFIVLGGVLFIGCGILVFLKIRRTRVNSDD